MEKYDGIKSKNDFKNSELSLLLELSGPQIVSLNLFKQFTQTKFGKKFHLSGFWVNAQLENIIIYRTSHNIQRKFEFWHRCQKSKLRLNRISFKLLFPEINFVFYNDWSESWLVINLITVPTHNSHIFVRPKKCDYFSKSDYLGDRGFSGTLRISDRKYWLIQSCKSDYLGDLISVTIKSKDSLLYFLKIIK